MSFRKTLPGVFFAAVTVLAGSAGMAGGTDGALPPGAFDPTFGTGGSGQVVFSYGSSYDYGRQILIQPDEKYLISGYGSNLGANIGIGFVARHHHDGSFDASFNGTGRFVFGDEEVGGGVLQTLLQPDGKIVVIGYDYLPAGGSGTVRGVIRRLNADGSIDQGFGSGGIVRMSGGAMPWLYLRSAALLPDGRLVVAGTEADLAVTDIRPFTLRVLANGQPDPSYAAGGRLSFNDLASGMRPQRAALDASGKLTLAGYIQVPGSNPLAFRAVVVRLNADGSPDTGFATGGKFIYTIPGLDNQFNDLFLDVDGVATLVGEAYGNFRAGFAVRLLPGGQPDPSFGTQGVVSLPADVALASGVAMQPDRKLVITGSRLSPQSFDALALRLMPNGSLDASFGTAGITAQSFGYPRSYAQSVAIDVDGKIVIAGIALPPGGNDHTLLARLIGVENSVQSDCFFDWAGITYPSFFAPTGAISRMFSPYYYRYYVQTNSYLGISSVDNHVYYLGPLSNNSIIEVGGLPDWLSTSNCQ